MRPGKLGRKQGDDIRAPKARVFQLPGTAAELVDQAMLTKELAGAVRHVGTDEGAQRGMEVDLARWHHGRRRECTDRLRPTQRPSPACAQAHAPGAGFPASRW